MTSDEIVLNSIKALHENVVLLLNEYEIGEEELDDLESTLDLLSVSLPISVFNTTRHYIENQLMPLVYSDNCDGNSYQEQYLSAKRLWLNNIVNTELRPFFCE